MATIENMTTIRRSTMDHHQLDNVVRLAAGAPRRQMLKGLLSAALVVLPGALHPERAGAKQCRGVGRRCRTDSDCCSAFCEPIGRQCVASCDVGEGICGVLTPCSLGCSCYRVELNQQFAGQACLQDPAGGTTTPGQECPGTDQCSPRARKRGGCPCGGPADCPKGFLCTASSCCQPDSVCLPLCEPTGV
jgi:hypothetical protein